MMTELNRLIADIVGDVIDGAGELGSMGNGSLADVVLRCDTFPCSLKWSRFDSIAFRPADALLF